MDTATIPAQEITGFSKPGSPAALGAVLVYRFAGDLIREITILTSIPVE